ncbi:hypothetical protein BaRGS_00001491 [Batillaria attramentaria]|uniref:Uncharacterized protein n=1 Tax=Batillaria attramentaria TaxID=370345 RepID=A0ABD0M881_9CAEN
MPMARLYLLTPAEEGRKLEVERKHVTVKRTNEQNQITDMAPTPGLTGDTLSPSARAARSLYSPSQSERAPPFPVTKTRRRLRAVVIESSRPPKINFGPRHAREKHVSGSRRRRSQLGKLMLVSSGNCAYDPPSSRLVKHFAVGTSTD